MAATRRPDRSRELMLRAIVYAILVFILLPSLVIIPMSFGEDKYLHFPPRGFTLDWYRQFLLDPEWRRATWLSVQVAAIVAVAATALGTLGALALVRGEIAGRGLVNLLLLSPLIVPNIVLAIAMFFFLARLGLTGTLLGFVLGHTVLAFPFVVLTVSSSLYQLDSDLELAALNLGATRLQIFRRITVPLIMPGIVSGAIFAFIISFDEPVISFFISAAGQTTLPRKMFEDIDQNITPVLAAVATVVTAVSLVGLGLVLLSRASGKHLARAPGTAAEG